MRFGQALLALLAVSLAGVASVAIAQDKTVRDSNQTSVTFRIADLQGLTESDWGGVQALQVGEKDSRTVKANKTGTLLPLPAWWDLQANPHRLPSGTRFTFEIVYQDTAKSPIVLSSYSAASNIGGRTELHRFGGTGDGKWKTQAIPSGWDLHYVKKGEKTVDLFIKCDADVPIASVTIRGAQADDEARWEAETRQWVAQQQAAKRKDAQPYRPAQTPQLPAGEQRPLAPFVRNYLQLVLSESAPQEGEMASSLHLRMALNQYEPAAFGVYANGQKLTHVTFDVSPLKGNGGELACAIEKRTAEYSVIPSPRREGGAPYTTFPQRLWMMYPVEIEPNHSHWFWIIAKTDEASSKPGKYSGVVTIHSDQGQATLPITVEVMNLHLLSMDEANLSMGGCEPGLLPMHEVAELLQYNNNCWNCWSANVCPPISKDGDSITIDASELNDWMVEAKKTGLRSVVWFLGGNPYGFPGTMTLQRQLYNAMFGTKQDYINAQNQDKGEVLPKIKPLYSKWVHDLIGQSRVNHWPEIILTPFDEPAKWSQNRQGTGPWIKSQFEECCKLIHEAAPGVRIYGSIHHAASGLIFLKDIDIFCTNAISEDQTLGEKTMAAGKTFWQYSGTDIAPQPDRARYTFGWYFAAYHSIGSLAWAYHWFDEGSGIFDNSGGDQWGYGWTSPWSVIPSPYLEAMRAAWDDRRYIATLRKLAKDKGVDESAFFARLDKEILSAHGGGGRDTVTDFWDAAGQVTVVDHFRDEVIEEIQKLQK